MNTPPPEAMITLVTINGLANRLSALSTFLGFAERLRPRTIRVIWPREPGVCTTTPEELFQPDFISRYFVKPNEKEFKILRDDVRLGVHYNTTLPGWTLMAGRLEEYRFIQKFESVLRATSENGWIISGGPITYVPPRKRGLEYWEERRRHYRHVHFLRQFSPPDTASHKFRDPPIALHVRTNSFAGQFPSKKNTRRIIRGLLPSSQPQAALLVVADSKSTAEEWRDYFRNRGIEVLEHDFVPTSQSTGRVHQPPEVADFFALSRAKIILSVFWSTFAREAALASDAQPRIFSLRRWPRFVFFSIALFLRRLKEATLIGKIRKLRIFPP